MQQNVSQWQATLGHQKNFLEPQFAHGVITGNRPTPACNLSFATPLNVRNV